MRTSNGRAKQRTSWISKRKGLSTQPKVIPPGLTPPAPTALEIRVIEKGSVPWRPQVYHVDLDLKPGKLYRISFWLKADRPHTVTTNLMMHHDPWIGFGSFEPTVSTEWQHFEYAVRVPESVEVQKGRVSFTNLEAGATYWIADLSVKEVRGRRPRPAPGEDLANGVSRPRWESLGMRSSQVQQDYIEFLWDVRAGILPRDVPLHQGRTGCPRPRVRHPSPVEPCRGFKPSSTTSTSTRIGTIPIFPAPHGTLQTGMCATTR